MSTWQKLNDGYISHRHTSTDAHNMLNGNRRRASYFFYIFCSEDLQLLQQPIDAWQFLQHLLYRTPVKKANAPGLTRTYYYTNMLHLCRSYPCPGCVASGVDRYDCYFKFFPFLCEFWINLVFFQITSQVVNASRARPYRFHSFHIHC